LSTRHNMKKSIKDYDLNNKKVIIRVDFNVPIKNNEIQDDNRIIKSLKTIKYAASHGAKVILMSHLGRIKSISDKENNSLKIVSYRLSELLNKEVIFINNTRGKELESAINNLKCGDILLMENTRFEDLNGKLESSNDDTLGKYWASLGDIFINDAFATSHRAHASNVGIASNLDSGIGFLIEEELEKLMLVTNNPEKPFVVILGGSKVSDKIGVIKSLVSKSDYLLIGGGMCFTFLKALGYNVGSSILDNESIDFCKSLLLDYKDKIILPTDFITSKKLGVTPILKNINEFDSDDIGFDIGSETIKNFEEILSNANTVLWNGPLGYFELEVYSSGTRQILNYLSNIDKKVILGGGDTASSAINFGYKDSFTHISTGGGATLELIEGKSLPGIEVIDDE